ncbi:hypothetical protein [Sphingomonas faeni]|uniref:hypothetical protein n=1 Tax=Sphingomonas faeni TaxID=185950 RepID=UPI003349DB6E
MALRVFDPCPFHFADQDIRVDIAVITGERSLSGFQDVDGTGGGGIWLADFAGADFGDRNDAGRAETLFWRAVNGGMQGGATAVDVLFCDRLHQPVLDSVLVPHSDGTPFSDDTLYASSGAQCVVVAVVNGQILGNAATVLDIRLTSERALLAGERFSYVGASGWGWRAAETYAVEDRGGGVTRVTFSPPIRGGVAVGDSLDFDTIRCQMTRTSPASNALSDGAFSTATISFQEDMRPPVLP